jgi:hypothetical protein
MQANSKKPAGMVCWMIYWRVLLKKQLPEKDLVSGIHNKEYLLLSLSYAMILSLQNDIYQ